MVIAVNELQAYQKAALKLAVISPMTEGGGYSAVIPGFKGLIVFGATIKETRTELASVLEGWIAVSLKRGCGLPTLTTESRELATAH